MKRILVVDDSGAIRKAIRRILEPMGYHVEEAGDGAIGLQQCEASAFDAVLCDIDMPNLDGLGFLGALRARADLAQPPVIMCTTHNTFDKIQAALGLGASEYIMKPFDAEIIGGKLAGCGVLP
ncbi:MAG: response regulator [Gemmatimonadetes bacterium]|nr:response regulator [Gemmatimonadota bacterium]